VSVGVASDQDQRYFPVAETLSSGTWVPSVLPQPADVSTEANGSPIVASVSCPTDGSCAAAGEYDAVDASNGQSYSEPLLEVLSDGVWTATQGQLPNGPYSGSVHLYSVSCPVQGSCTAVGDDNDFSGPQVTFGLIYSLSFGQWQLQIAPEPADFSVQVLASVSCPSSDSCVVVGSGSADDEGLGLIETFSSGAWNAIITPLPADAAGPPPAGSGWGGPGLTSVDCPQVGTCLAGGSYRTASNQTLPLLVNLAFGTWTPSVAPLPANAYLDEPAYSGVEGVSCPAENSCVATGFYGIGNGFDQAGFILTQNGGTWSATEAPLPTIAASDHRRRHAGGRVVADSSSTSTSLGNVSCGSDGFCNALGTDAGTNFMESGQLSVLGISGISPNSGALAGGTTVTVTGSNFTPATTISFGDTPATTTTFENANELQVETPAASYGLVNVIATDGANVSRANEADEFSYQSTTAQTTTVSVLPSVNPILTGQPVSYAISVSPAPDGGTVSLTDGFGLIATCSNLILTTGTASCEQTYKATLGGSSSDNPFEIVARYSGDADFQPSGAIVADTLDAGSLVVTTTSLPAGKVHVSYKAEMVASGGNAPLRWKVTSGHLPKGLTLSKTGMIRGKPRRAGSFTFTVTASDASKPKAESSSTSLTISIAS